MKSNHDSNELTPSTFAKHAPKVWGLLSEALVKETPAAGVNIANLFEALVAKNLLEHPGIKREAGVSFNPRPARHLEIILREASRSNSEIWLASLIAIMMEQDQTIRLVGSELESAHQRAQKVLKFELAPTQEPIDEGSLTILLSRSLDNLRHAHMADPEVLSLDQTLLIADALVAICTDSPATGRLPLLVRSAVERIRSRVRR